MKAIVNALALAGALFSLLPAMAPTAAAREGSGQDGADRWVASIAGISGISVQDWDAKVSSLVCRDCTIPDPLMREEELRPPASGDDTDVSPYAGLSLELMTPELPVPGSPRLFIGGEVMGSFGSTRKIAQEGDPGTIESPLPEGTQGVTFGDDTALGQGSQTVGEMSDVMYGVYAGVSFPLEIYGRPLRIRPAIAWIRYEIDIDGLVVDADCRPAAGGTTSCNTAVGGFLRETRLAASSTEDFDGIGPALDVELDTGRLGPIGTSIFAGARFYRILGDRKVKLTAGPQTVDDILGQDSSAARFEFEVDEWMYRFGLGVRLQWLGLED
jgi:hypothetical protein